MVQTLEDDFQQNLRLRLLQKSIAKKVLSCNGCFSNVKYGVPLPPLYSDQMGRGRGLGDTSSESRSHFSRNKLRKERKLQGPSVRNSSRFMTEVYDSKAPKMMQGISKPQPSRLFFRNGIRFA